MSMADAYISRRRSSRVPKVEYPDGCSDLVRNFWDIRSFVGGVDTTRPTDMSDVEKWQRHSGIELESWERDAVFEMCRALRRGYMNSVKFHMKRHAGRSGKNNDG